jgi:hypothetical protein
VAFVVPRFVRSVGIIGKAPVTLSCPSVRPSACVNAAPTGRISVKFDTGDFYENMLRKPTFG